MVADDNPAALHIIAEMFRRWDMQVDLAASGAEVLQVMEGEARAGRHYDLLLIDWNMPVMDGLQTVRALRASQLVTRQPQVAVMTAYDVSDVVRIAMPEDDIGAFLCKPVTPAKLLQALAGIVAPAIPVSVSPAVPASVVASGPALAPISSPKLPPELCRRPILLVEDNDINREIALELLVSAGLTVDWAENGVVACAKVARQGADYAAVVMDVQMPEMDGIAATREIRRHHPADRLPIIALTAHAYVEERWHCLEAGMNDHLTKPIDPALLLQTLQTWLSRAAADPGNAGLPASLPPFDLTAGLARRQWQRRSAAPPDCAVRSPAFHLGRGIGGAGDGGPDGRGPASGPQPQGCRGLAGDFRRARDCRPDRGRNRLPFCGGAGRWPRSPAGQTCAGAVAGDPGRAQSG